MHDAGSRIEDQRQAISGTVDEIENRVSPGRIIARRRSKMRNTLTDWKDSVLGNDEPHYPDPWSTGTPAGRHGAAYGNGTDTGSDSGMRDKMSGAAESVQHTPDAIRRQTRGNPFAAGAIALGAGWLVGSVLPESRTERKLAHDLEPRLEQAASAVKSEGQELAHEMKADAKDAVDQVKDTGRDAADEVKQSGQDAARNVKDS